MPIYVKVAIFIALNNHSILLFHIWIFSRDKSIQTFVGHRGREVNAIYFDELRIASAAYDNKIRIWDFNV